MSTTQADKSTTPISSLLYSQVTEKNAFAKGFAFDDSNADDGYIWGASTVWLDSSAGSILWVNVLAVPWDASETETEQGVGWSFIIQVDDFSAEMLSMDSGLELALAPLSKTSAVLAWLNTIDKTVDDIGGHVEGYVLEMFVGTEGASGPMFTYFHGDDEHDGVGFDNEYGFNVTADASINGFYVDWLASNVGEGLDSSYAKGIEIDQEFQRTSGGDVLMLGDPSINDFVLARETVLHGTSRGDVFIHTENVDVIYGREGNDTITLTADAVWGSGYGAQNVSNDSSVGTNEIVSIEGLNRFTDVLDGGDDIDTLVLTNGNDAFFIDDVYSSLHSSLTLSATSQGIDSTARLVGIEIINAGDGNDIVDLTSDNFVLTNAVTINGEAGNDVLWGSNGDDTINGGVGDDSIFGGAGNDTLTGGAGKDVFQFTATSGQSNIITDFSLTDDVIKLFYREGDDHTLADLDLDQGILTWDVLIDDVDNVLIDLSATTTSSDLADLSGFITFIEIA